MEGTLSSIAIIKRDLVDDSIDSCFILT